MGYRRGEVLHLSQAGARGLGVSSADEVSIRGHRDALDLAGVSLPSPHWYFHAPAWAAVPLRRITRLRPKMTDTAFCIGCGKCAEACPQGVITSGQPPTFDLDRCIGCLCCAEVCPQGAIEPHRNLLAKLIGMGY
jgi:ferredoxin